MHLSNPASPRRPRVTLLALAGGVALLHLGLWHGMADSFAASAAPERSQAVLQVRTVEPPAPPVAEPLKRAVVAKPAMPVPRRIAAAPAVHTPQPESLPAAPSEPVLVAAALPVQPALELTPVVATSAPDEVPIYRTQMPPAMTLHYDMRRGALSGTGELQWRPTANGYQARLEGRIAGFSILTWASEGGFDAAGIAPVRYTDLRRGKNEQAANFQRNAGKISFSGPSTEYPLLEGSQDRLSWMIQIAAIASADPKRMDKGARVAMYVVGAHGDADVWAFHVQGMEEVTTGDTTVQAIKLLREPRKPYDTRVEVWLAPSMHHLPVRARLTSDGSTLELLLQTIQPAS
ncbi:MAG: DUF3108 domain-containing protein [Rhizobacter sp.]